MNKYLYKKLLLLPALVVFGSLFSFPKFAQSNSTIISAVCAGQESNGLWAFICSKVAGAPNASTKSDSAGMVAIIPDGASGDIEIIPSQISAPRSSVRLGPSGAVEVVDAAGRVTFRDFKPLDVPNFAPEMPSVAVVGDLPLSGGGSVKIDLRSPSPEVSSGRAVYIGNAPNIDINVSGRAGSNGRDAGTAAAIAAASGEYGAGQTAVNLASKMNLTSTTSVPSMTWSDLSSAAAKCENLGGGFKAPPASEDGGRSVVIGVEKAREQVVTRNICERLTSQEVSVQSTCVRPGEIAGTVTCDYPDISRRVGVYRRPAEEKTVSFSCATGDLSGEWKTSCVGEQHAVVASVLRPDYVVVSPSNDIAKGMRIPLQHNFPTTIALSSPCKKQDSYSLFSLPGGSNYLDISGFDPTNGAPISAGGANRYINGSEFSSFVTPAPPAYISQPSNDLSSYIKSGGVYQQDDCGNVQTKLSKLSLLGALISPIKQTSIPGSVGDISQNDTIVTNLGYWAKRGSKGVSPTPDRNITDALAGIKVPAKASAHDASYASSLSSSDGGAQNDTQKFAAELSDLGLMPITKSGAVVSYTKLTAKRERLIAGNSFRDAIRPMIEASSEKVLDSSGALVLSPSSVQKVDAFLSRVTSGASASTDVLNIKFREKITYKFSNIRIGLATKKSSSGVGDTTIYRAVSEPLALAPRAIYIPGEFSAEPIATVKYCDTVDIDDRELFFSNGEAVSIGSVELTNGQRINMRSPVNTQNIMGSNEASSVTHSETPNNFFSGWGMSFVKVNSINLAEKNGSCTASSASVSVTHTMSSGQKSILNKIKNSSGLLIVGYGSGGDSTIDIYFSPAKTPKPTNNASAPKYYINTGISDGVYFPRINVSPAEISATSAPAGPSGRGFSLLTSETQIPHSDDAWAPINTIGSNAGYSMKANFAQGLEYFDIPTIQNDGVTPFFAEGTRALSDSNGSVTAGAVSAVQGTPARAAKYIKSLRKMSLAISPQNPNSSTSTLARENSGGLLRDVAGQPVALLAQNIGTYTGLDAPAQYCTAENFVESFVYPTKLISRRAVAGETTGSEIDMNITSNEEVSDSVGSINKRIRDVGYFSRAFLPAAMTVGLNNKEKNRSDPYYIARDYNTYLADIQKNSSLQIASNPYSDFPSFKISSSTETVSPLGPNRGIITIRKPYDLNLDFQLVNKKLSEIGGLSPAASVGSAGLRSGRRSVYDPGIWACLNNNRSLACFLNSAMGTAESFTKFLPPFTLVNGKLEHEDAISCSVLDDSCTSRGSADVFYTAEVDLTAPENPLFRPMNMDGANWREFVRCSNGVDYMDRSDCTHLFGIDVKLRKGYKRPYQPHVESSEMSESLRFDSAARTKYLNKTYFTGLLVPGLSPITATYVSSNFGALTREGVMSSGLPFAEEAGLVERPKDVPSLLALGYTNKRIRLIGGPMSSTDGGALYFEGTLGLPLLGADTRLWLEWWETGALAAATSGGLPAYYKTFNGIIDALASGPLSVMSLSPSNTLAAYTYQQLAPSSDESPAAAYSRIAAGVGVYAGPTDLATQNGCSDPVSAECFSMRRGQKGFGASTASGGTTFTDLSRKGISGYMFTGCGDNLNPASKIQPRGNLEGASDRHGFTAEPNGPNINFTSDETYTLYLPFALRDWDGAYFGPVVGADYSPLYRDGFKHNALVVEDRSAAGRSLAGVDVYLNGSAQKIVSELAFGDSAVIYETNDGRGTSITLDAAVLASADVVQNPAIAGAAAYESPLAISPDVLLAIFAHEDFGATALDGDVLVSKQGTGVYLLEAISSLASPYTKQKAMTDGFSLNRLASRDGVASGIILAPTENSLNAKLASVAFSWIVSNDSILATVASANVSDGAQSGVSSLSGGKVNGVAGGVAIAYGSVLGALTDERGFTPANSSSPQDQIIRSQGVRPALMSGAGFNIRPMDPVSGISPRLQTDIDGGSRVPFGTTVAIQGQESSAFFLAEEICGEYKISSSLTSTHAIQNTSMSFNYCGVVDANGSESPLYSVRSENECSQISGSWRSLPINGSSGASGRINPYAAICAYAATAGRQTSQAVPSRWDELAGDTPSLVPANCTFAAGATVCSIDQSNTMNNIYWGIQSKEIAYGYDAYGVPTGSFLQESDDPRSPTVCPAGTRVKSQQFVSNSNPDILTFSAMDNFAGADFDINGKAQCPYSCSVSGVGISSENTCLSPASRPPETASLPAGTWSRMTKVSSVNVQLFSDPALCYSQQSGASVRDMRTEQQKLAGSYSCGGTYGKCSKPGRFNQISCQSDALPGGAGVWTPDAPTDSSFVPTSAYGVPSTFISTAEAAGNLVAREGTPYTILSDIVEVEKRTAASLGAKTIMRGGDGEADSLGYIWVKESLYERPLCEDFYYSKTDGTRLELAGNSPDVGVLLPRFSSIDERRRYGNLDPYMVRTKARQVTIEGGVGTNIAAYADSCDFNSVEAADAVPIARPGYDVPAGLGLNIMDFARRIGIDYIRGEAVSVTRVQPTPWSTEVVGGNGFTPPSCDIFSDPTIAVREGRVSTDPADLPADLSFFIGEERGGVNRRSAFKANPATMRDSSSRNSVQAFAYGGSWHKIGEERIELTKSNSTSTVSCRFYTDSSFGNDSCTAPINISTESVSGQAFNIIAENGQNGGAAGTAVALSTIKPSSVRMLSEGGAAGAAGGTDLEGQPEGNMMCYAVGGDVLNPSIRMYRFQQSSATVKPGAAGFPGPGGADRTKAYWGIPPESRKWLQKNLSISP